MCMYACTQHPHPPTQIHIHTHAQSKNNNNQSYNFTNHMQSQLTHHAWQCFNTHAQVTWWWAHAMVQSVYFVSFGEIVCTPWWPGTDTYIFFSHTVTHIYIITLQSSVYIYIWFILWVCISQWANRKQHFDLINLPRIHNNHIHATNSGIYPHNWHNNWIIWCTGWLYLFQDSSMHLWVKD